MKQSPFIYGSIVSSDAFTNREVESKKIYNNLVQGINTTIISPRRWGKSSLVEKVIDDINLNEDHIKTVIIDLFTISGEEEFLEIFAKEIIKASSSKWEDWVKSGKELFKQLIPRISMGIDPLNDFSISFNLKELKKHKDEILNLPELIATKKQMNFIICLDEFQNLANYSGYDLFEKRMRANWQRQKKVTYCLYGSKKHMMTDIFNNPSKPFYRFGDTLVLKKISLQNWVEFIINGFKRTGKDISKKDATLIPKLMKNHSWYTQQFSHYIWQKTENKVTKNEIITALEELIYANTPLYQKDIESISNTQLNLLKAIVNKEKQFTSNAVMQKYNLGTPQNVIKNKKKLIKIDIIDEVDGCYELLDPAFELWFLKQFNNRHYAI